MKHGQNKAKVHLVVYRDPVSGAQALRLRAPLFQEAWQNELVAAAANTARGMLQDRPSLARVVALAQNAMAAASRVADGLLAQAPAGSVACQAGCDHCCHQTVGLTAPEAIALFDHLQRTRSGAELEELAQRVARSYERTRGLSANERFSPVLSLSAIGRRALLGLRSAPAGLPWDELARRARMPPAAA